MKRIIVACGNGVATSQAVAFRINRMLEKNHLYDVKVEAVNIRELHRELKGAVAYVEVMKTDEKCDIPKIDGLVFLYGNANQKKEEFQRLLDILK